MFSPGELRPEPTTEAALLRQLAVDRGGGRFKDKTTAINSATATQNNLPSDFILAYAPASEGQSLQGREPKFSSNRRLNGGHAARVMPLNRAFGA